MFSSVDESVLFLLSLLALFMAMEVGFRLGRRHQPRSDDGWKSHTTALQAALLGLLALLLGFNFVMASSRFESRKTLIQEETNAIGTAWLRAQFLPTTHQGEISELLKRYLSARISYMRAGLDDSLIESAIDEASAVEAQILKLTQTMVADNSGGPQLSPFLQSFNDMINAGRKRRALLSNHVPEPVLNLLFIVAVGSFGFIGYGYGLTGRRRHISTAIFATLIALVLITILDFDRPRGGFIRVGDESMVRLQTSLEKYKQ